MKNNKGITLIALTITIIVTIILALVTTYDGVSVLKESKEKRLLSELDMVQHAVLENYTKYLMTKGEVVESKYLVGTEVNTTTVKSKLVSGIELKAPTTISDNSQKYYSLSEQDLEKIGVTQSKYSYIVNYATGEVINEQHSKTNSGKPLYVYSVDLR